MPWVCQGISSEYDGIGRYLVKDSVLSSADLGGVEDEDGRLILQDVALGVGQRVQDLVLGLLQRPVVVRRLHNQRLPLRLQLRTGGQPTVRPATLRVKADHPRIRTAPPADCTGRRFFGVIYPDIPQLEGAAVTAWDHVLKQRELPNYLQTNLNECTNITSHIDTCSVLLCNEPPPLANRTENKSSGFMHLYAWEGG